MVRRSAYLFLVLLVFTALNYSESQAAERVSLQRDVIPVLTKQACNSGACHGSPSGKGGFRLSLRGFDAEFDQKTLLREAFGRRVNPARPEQSLLLLKPTMDVAHGGGRKLKSSDAAYQVLRDWIAQGCRPDDPAPSPITKLEVEVVGRTQDQALELRHPNWTQRLIVRAQFADGSIRDVTQLTDFLTTDDQVASVAPDGVVSGVDRGEAVVLARYLDQVAVTSLTFLKDVPGFHWSAPSEANFIDASVFAKLKRLQIAPSELCSDEEFLRRVTLDVTGQLPTIQEAKLFLADDSANKRDRVIDELLQRDTYADFWALKLADLLQVKASKLSLAGVPKFYKWLRDSVRLNRPYDQVAYELLTAQGSSYENPPAAFYRTTSDPNAASEVAAQLFLGVRIQCAKCHNHPYERWTQDNYYGLGAFFSRVRSQSSESTDDVLVWLSQAGEVAHPRTGQAAPLLLPVGGLAVIGPDEDRREAFARWLTARENPFFAKVAVNRIWGHVMGRGLVDPVDDFRDSNPASHPELLDMLAAELVRSGFDQQHILRTILKSRVYQLSSRTNEFNASDAKYFSHATARLLTAEQLLDAISQVTGNEEKFVGLPLGMRATQLPSPDAASSFLTLFGRPSRNSACECERGDDPKLPHALQMISGEIISKKLRGQGSKLGRSTDDATLRVQAAGQPPIDHLKLWLRADMAALDARQSVASDGDAVTAWHDQSGAARHVLQTDVGRQPSFRARAISNLPALHFDSEDSLTHAADAVVAENGPRTVLVVAQTGAAENGGTLLTFRRGRPLFTVSHVLYGGTYYVYSDGVNGSGNSNLPAPAFDAIRKPFLTAFTSVAAGQKLRVIVNGKTTDVVQPGAVGPDSGVTGFTIGNREDVGGFGWQGDIAEILVYDKVLSAVELTSAGTYLATKYALETTYPQHAIPRSPELVQQDGQLIEELYLAAFTRRPSASERQAAMDYIAQSEERRQGLEDIYWALMNSKEFLFQH